jgi:osmotically inducible protein OsmC
MPIRTANAKWTGSTQGSGTMAFGSGAYEGPYSFQSRFEEGDGTNPEELIGAAHAGCFSMALSLAIGQNGHTPESVETTAKVHLDKQGEGFAITKIELTTRARVPGLDADGFQELANLAKQNCPVSRALASIEIALDAELVG